jgi:hypothetical protein
MTRRRCKSSHWSDSLPDDEWTNRPKVHIFRLEPYRKPRYIGTHLAFLVDESYVQGIYGGGEYLYIAVHRGRVCLRGTILIEGPPIRRRGIS